MRGRSVGVGAGCAVPRRRDRVASPGLRRGGWMALVELWDGERKYHIVGWGG